MTKVRKPRPFWLHGVPTLECRRHPKYGRLVNFYGEHMYVKDLRRLAKFATEAAAWCEQQQAKGKPCQDQ